MTNVPPSRSAAALLRRFLVSQAVLLGLAATLAYGLDRQMIRPTGAPTQTQP